MGTVKSVVAEHSKLDNVVERDMTGAFIPMVSHKMISDLPDFAFAALIQSFVIVDFLSHSLLELFTLRVPKAITFFVFVSRDFAL